MAKSKNKPEPNFLTGDKVVVLGIAGGKPGRVECFKRGRVYVRWPRFPHVCSYKPGMLQKVE